MSIETEHVPDLPRFGRYRCTAALGTGAMGAVYAAYDEVLGRSVAVKTMKSAGNELDPNRRRFVQEARAIGSLVHPNIVAIYDSGIVDETPYLVMELAGGGTLASQLEGNRRLPADAVRSIGIQIASALAAAHAIGILHRDVKPANLLVTTCVERATGGVWKLADFGIAHLPDSTLTITGQFLGSPSYAAPEALLRGAFSPAADVFSLGATLYEALAGEPPRGVGSLEAIFARARMPARPLRERGIAIPAALESAILDALAIDPAERPTADAFARRLADASMSQPRALPQAAQLVGLPFEDTSFVPGPRAALPPVAQVVGLPFEATSFAAAPPRAATATATSMPMSMRRKRIAFAIGATALVAVALLGSSSSSPTPFVTSASQPLSTSPTKPATPATGVNRDEPTRAPSGIDPADNAHDRDDNAHDRDEDRDADDRDADDRYAPDDPYSDRYADSVDDQHVTYHVMPDGTLRYAAPQPHTMVMGVETRSHGRGKHKPKKWR